jgi:peptidoglycan/xylan/chitin deacetylase (PgdA/CDA1 family)
VSNYRYSRLQQVAHRLCSTIAPGSLILFYHNVAGVDSDPWSLSVTPSHFAEHLDVIRRVGSPVQLQQLKQAVQDRRRLPRSIVITFDDGYAGNYHNAKPLLEERDIPATIFVANGCIGQNREFWWDELERILLQPGTLPDRLTIELDRNVRHWELDGAVDYTQEEYQQHRGWDADRQTPPTPRHVLYLSLHRLIRQLSGEQRHRAMEQLLAWSGASREARPDYRALSLTELRALGQSALIEIGAHTVSHPMLSARPVAEQQEEIERGKTELETMLMRQVSSFSYPYGSYTAETVTAVRESGFDCACSTQVRGVWRGHDLYQLPRVEVKDWDGATFAKRLARWFKGDYR